MKLSCSLDCFGDEPWRDVLPRIAGAGFDAVELSSETTEREFSKEEHRLSGLRALLDKNNLCLSAINITDCSANEPAPDWLSNIRQQMTFARQMGVAGVNVRTGERRRQSMGALVNVLGAVVELAEELKVDVHLANALGRRVEQVEDLRYVVAEVNHSRLRVLIDAGHAHMAAVNPVHLVGEFVDLTDVVRLSDRLGRQRVAIGEGEISIPTIMNDLRRAEYAGWLVYEPDEQGRDTKSLTAARICLRHIASLLS
jgi:sugar phosphate isomerase/epimerase